LTQQGQFHKLRWIKGGVDEMLREFVEEHERDS